jgi:hypothetical protein
VNSYIAERIADKIVVIYMINACIHIHANSYEAERMADACVPHIRANVCDCVSARTLACVVGCTRIRAETCEHLPSAWIACGSAGRRSSLRQHSTKILPHGTWSVSPH